ncbi:MAG TPA: chemotaxis protein CheB [Steroidobacteraceae bacterium]|nr:chemotaxis protein CheB [Steroidobacteraceae bacterium]
MAQVKPLPGEESRPEFCVIGIGASAGGLDALRMFFSRMPPTPGFACVVVLHLSPEHESHLVQMLQPYTKMPVCQVVKTTALEPNRVYVIPPNANLNSIDTHLRLTELETRRNDRATIDHFLRTLAETHGETAVGVILSGAGSDGALGIRQIKEHGGLTIAQDPQEAEFGSMPQSAIGTGTVDVVLRVRDIPGEIVSYCATHPALAVPDANDDIPAEDASILDRILSEVRQRTGQDFAMYTRAMILQRLRRRMRLRRVDSLQAYFEELRDHAEEPRALCDELLLNVTEFFRDPVHYATIERAIRELLGRKSARDNRVRIWSIGCSTGEEAYSLAMVLLEQGGGRDYQPLPQVFASEQSSQILEQAREGVYPQEISAAISPERLDRFFVHENGRYRVRRDLRDTVIFATHDLFKDPPYSHLDLIVCRNLLRDLQPAMRRAVLNLFYYALEPHGILVVGTEDHVDSTGLFARDAADPRLLRRMGGSRRLLQLPGGIRPFSRAGDERGGSPVAAEALDLPSLFRKATEPYVPPSVLIDTSDCVLHFSASASRYVRIPGGELTLDILRLVPEAIGYRLSQGLEAVRHGQSSWTSERFAIPDGNEARRLTIRIDRAGPAARASELLLVVFDDTLSASERTTRPLGQEASEDVTRLRGELHAVHQQLEVLSRKVRTGAMESAEAREQHDDELSTMVQELDSARAELQAANEELLSINQESHLRIDALAQLSNDMQHMFESTGFAALLVDRTLRINRFTPLAAALLRLRDGDLQRPLADLDLHFKWETLIADVQRVIDEPTELEREVETADGRWFLVRGHPYRTAMRGLEGAAIVFLDITERKRADLALRESDRRKEEFLAVLAHELRNPLAPIVAGLEVLRADPPDTALRQRIVATMTRQTHQLARLVDDLLEVRRISEGKVILRMQAVSVAEVLRDALASVRPLAEAQQQTITVDLPDEPLNVEGDAVRLTQVIGNLLHNAVRYTPAHGSIAARAQRANEQVMISVQDTGCGMSAESLKNAFEMFYQANESPRNGSGLGIGLTLARKLVEMHSGAICAESPGVGLGSKFTVRLPLARRAGTPSVDPTIATPQASSRHRVLIVDDNDDAAETLGELVKTLDRHEVRTATSGHDALEAAALLQPDVVLLDLSMPGMDGYEVARRMRATVWGERALLVALTGWGQDQHRRRSKEAGFDCHLTKPADPEALRALLNGASHRRPAGPGEA